MIERTIEIPSIKDRARRLTGMSDGDVKVSNRTETVTVSSDLDDGYRQVEEISLRDVLPDEPGYRRVKYSKRGSGYTITYTRRDWTDVRPSIGLLVPWVCAMLPLTTHYAPIVIFTFILASCITIPVVIGYIYEGGASW